jgi:predicted RNase H-like nuclease
VPSVYVETSIPSYLVAEPSGVLVIAARQKLTHDWWEHLRPHFALAVSEFLVEEIEQGDPEYASRRRDAIDGLPVLANSAEVRSLTEEYTARLGLTGRALIDVPHLAYAAVYELDYLLTWNMKHLANDRMLERLQRVNDDLGRPTPLVRTPDHMLATFEEDMT